MVLWAWDLWLARASPRRDLAANPLVLPSLALLATLCLATILGVDPRYSLWGSLERGQGLLTLICYPSLALLVASRMRDDAAAWRLVWTLILSSVPIVVLALVQATGLEPLPLTTDARSSVFSTLGRSNFLAAYLVLLLPLYLVGIQRLRESAWRSPLVLLLAGAGLTLGLTQVRGAWLAAGVSVGAFLFLVGLPRIRLQLARPSVITAGLAVLAVVAATGLLLAQAGGSGAARLATWQATTRLILARPFFGYGPDALELAFPRVYPPELVYYQGRNFFTDRAHNLFLDWAATAGLLGLIAFLAVVGVVLWLGVRAIARSGNEEGTRTLLLAAFVAALVGSLADKVVSFDVSPTATASWLLIGAVVALVKPRPALPSTSVRLRTDLARGLVVMAVAVAIAVSVIINIRPVAADVAARNAVHASEASRRGDAIRWSRDAIELWPGAPWYWALAAETMMQAAPGVETVPEENLSQAAGILEKSLQRHPLRLDLWVRLGRVYADWGVDFDAEKLQLAHRAFERAVELAPNHGTVFHQWAQIDLRTGAWEPAAAKLHRAVDLDITNLVAWLQLAALYEDHERPREAMMAYRQAALLAPSSVDAQLGLARTLIDLRDPDSARRAVEEALRRDPENEEAERLRAALESPTGDPDVASELHDPPN